jgi:predicted CXXCH cytochrome family protein
MYRSSKIVILPIVLILASLFLGDNPLQPVMILWPSAPDSVSYDQAKLLIVSAVKDTTSPFVVSTQWYLSRYMDVSPIVSKQTFPKDFYKLFDQKSLIQKLIYTFRFYAGYSVPETLSFSYGDTVTIRKLWTMPALTKMAQDVQSPEVLGLILLIKGWKDSVYSAVYDDPNAEGRALYKLHVQLIPGENKVYCGFVNQKNQAIEYATNYTAEYLAIEERKSHFHNSLLEQTCVTCHEGLPSADSGNSMKADCGVCHKTFAGSSFLHAPVEMKECSTCHTWSAEKKVFTSTKSVPDVCYDCHLEKRGLVDSSATQHPVAGECLTCHSPHGTNIIHQLKTDVYTLCSGCHEKYTLNHPVGKHPVRFAKIGRMFEEISCVSCHNPHGSPNESLLKVGGGRMAICLQCHDK